MNALDRLSVSGICTNRLSLEEDLQFWRRHGITTAGIPRRKLSPEGVSLLRESAIRVTSLLGFGPALDDRSTWTVARSQLRRMFSEAQEIGAETLVITTGPAGSLRWEEAADALATFLEPLGHEWPVPLLIEHTNQLRTDISFVTTLRDAVDLARDIGVGVVMEINACWMERALHQTIERSIDLIGLVQMSDTFPHTHCTPYRAVPGDGVVPIRPILRRLLDAGYPGVFELEVLGPRIEEEGYDSAVPRAVASLARMIEDAAAEVADG
jgi:sugar phosphate isomerase/epimerase